MSLCLHDDEIVTVRHPRQLLSRSSQDLRFLARTCVCTPLLHGVVRQRDHDTHLSIPPAVMGAPRETSGRYGWAVAMALDCQRQSICIDDVDAVDCVLGHIRSAWPHVIRSGIDASSTWNSRACSTRFCKTVSSL